ARSAEPQRARAADRAAEARAAGSDQPAARRAARRLAGECLRLSGGAMSMGPVYRLTLRQLSGRWRLIIMSVLAALPVLIAVLTLRTSSAPTVQEFETAVLSAMLSGSIAP